jgi:hypothetical protein
VPTGVRFPPPALFMKDYLQCPKCKSKVSKFAISRHIKSCSGNPSKFRGAKKTKNDLLNNFIKMGDDSFKCKICSKIYTKNGTYTHYWRAHGEGIGWNKNNENRVAWNKGLDKSDPRVEASSNTLRERVLNGDIIPYWRGKKHKKETKDKISAYASKVNLGGHTSKQAIYYKGVYLHSSYEVRTAKDLDKNNIKWTRPEPVYWFDEDNKRHRYYADFYLPDYDVYLDPKADYIIENINPRFGITDKEKIDIVMKQNNIRVFILREHELTWDKIKQKIIK